MPTCPDCQGQLVLSEVLQDRDISTTSVPVASTSSDEKTYATKSGRNVALPSRFKDSASANPFGYKSLMRRMRRSHPEGI